jgi:hypothetical protein
MNFIDSFSKKKCSNIKFHENPSSCRRFVPHKWTDIQTDGRTDGFERAVEHKPTKRTFSKLIFQIFNILIFIFLLKIKILILKIVHFLDLSCIIILKHKVQIT